MNTRGLDSISALLSPPPVCKPCSPALVHAAPSSRKHRQCLCSLPGQRLCQLLCRRKPCLHAMAVALLLTWSALAMSLQQWKQQQGHSRLLLLQHIRLGRLVQLLQGGPTAAAVTGRQEARAAAVQQAKRTLQLQPLHLALPVCKG